MSIWRHLESDGFVTEQVFWNGKRFAIRRDFSHASVKLIFTGDSACRSPVAPDPIAIDQTFAFPDSALNLDHVVSILMLSRRVRDIV